MTMKSRGWSWLILLLSAFIVLGGCTQPAPAETSAAPAAEREAQAEKKDDIIILYTSDIHCGIAQGFGMVGLAQVRDTFEKNGYTTLLVDAGDSVQGDLVGTVTKGEAMIDLMNAVKYDVTVPGNHDFDYGMDKFMELAEKKDAPYICLNFYKGDERIFDPYIIKEVNGKKIGFVGVTTPETLTASNPVNFQNEKGETIYSFMEDVSGTKLNNAIQETVDEVRAKGVDYVILLSHIGNKPSSNYNFQNIIENTTGIDAVLDGHSHDTDQVTMNNKDGEPVIRSATGTKLQGIGCLTISGEDGSLKADLLSWNNDYSVPDLFGMSNELSEPVAAAQDKVDEIMKVKIADTDYDLIIYDPEKKNDQGNPVRIVRNHETNLADLVADAVRAETEAEIALVNGGAVRDTIRAGEINYGEVVTVMPFFNSICVSEVAGQTLLDALEWGAHFQPGEFGGFMQVSGMTYEIDLDVPSSVTIDTEGNFASVEGAYRVKNVMINGEPLDTKKTYRVAGMEFFLKNGGDGYAMFSADDVVVDEICVDSQALIDYLQKDLNGVIPEEYSEPYGQGRITITGGEQQN